MSSVIFLVALAVAQAPIPGQPTPQKPAVVTPARDQKPAKGTSVIRGVVIDAQTGKPLRRVRVSVSGPGGSAAQTDAEGRFEIADLAAGNYFLNAEKAGYVSTLNVSIAARPEPIVVGDNQTVDKVVLALPKGGVIAGQVLDEGGDPLPGAQVQALRYRYVDGQRRLMPYYGGSGSSSTFTDDLGAYRLYGLAPGEYYVSAQGGRDFAPFASAPPNTEGPGQTYYPGTPNPLEARRVSVRAARETSGVTFPITFIRLSRVRGRVQSVNPEGLAGGNLSVSPRDPGVINTYSFSSGIRPDGTFEVSNLQPGTYMLEARPRDSMTNDDAEVAHTVISVNGEDINDLVLFAGRAGIARGRIVTDEGIPLPFPASSLRINAQSADRTPIFGQSPGNVQADGSFELKRLFGRVHIRAFPTGSSMQQWTFKGVLLEGLDVTDTGIEFELGQTVGGIDIVYTRKVTRLTGQLQDSAAPKVGTWIVVFPADESRWVPSSRYVRPTLSDAKGQFTLPLVPYDNYLIVAVRDIEDGQWSEPDLLRAIRDLATPFSIDEGETKVLNVRLVEWRK